MELKKDRIRKTINDLRRFWIFESDSDKIKLEKFKEVNNVWGFFPRGELVKVSSQFKVAGSKGNEYTVTEDSGKWSCTCPGFTFRGSCKHIKEFSDAMHELHQ